MWGLPSTLSIRDPFRLKALNLEDVYRTKVHTGTPVYKGRRNWQKGLLYMGKYVSSECQLTSALLATSHRYLMSKLSVP